MSNVDDTYLDAVEALLAQHREHRDHQTWPCCSGCQLAEAVPELLAEIKRLRMPARPLRALRGRWPH